MVFQSYMIDQFLETKSKETRKAGREDATAILYDMTEFGTWNWGGHYD